MFVVRRPFKSLGKCFTVGSTLEPTDCKLFKTKVAEGKIIEVTENNYETIKSFFQQKFGVVIPPINKEEVQTDKQPEEVVKAPVTPTKPATKPVAPVKTVVTPVKQVKTVQTAKK